MIALRRAGVGMEHVIATRTYKSARISTLLFIGTALLSTAVLADTVNLLAEKDNTLYEDDEGDLSNGAGDNLFTGRTNNSSLIRRAVIKFDIDGAVPAGATIDSVQLTLNVSRSRNSTAEDTALHRLNSDWGESGSNALVMGGGGGAAAEIGDATWQHTFS
jgi:hypothetical protein